MKVYSFAPIPLPHCATAPLRPPAASPERAFFFRADLGHLLDYSHTYEHGAFSHFLLPLVLWISKVVTVGRGLAVTSVPPPLRRYMSPGFRPDKVA